MIIPDLVLMNVTDTDLLHAEDADQTWAATWQNQKNDCVPSEDSDQPGHPPSLNSVFAERMNRLGSLTTHSAHSEDSDQTDHNGVCKPHRKSYKCECKEGWKGRNCGEKGKWKSWFWMIIKIRAFSGFQWFKTANSVKSQFDKMEQ